MPGSDHTTPKRNRPSLARRACALAAVILCTAVAFRPGSVEGRSTVPMGATLSRSAVSVSPLNSLHRTGGPTTGEAASEQESRSIRLASATSPDHSGLLENILPSFTESTGVSVQVIAVGTGKALRLAETGDVDLVLGHAPLQEQAFVDSGFGIGRRPVMYNDFVLVGPTRNLAGVPVQAAADAALARIAGARARFISRADASGTHTKELQLWQAASITPTGSWYLESGRGMASVLQMAHELDGYTLTDRGTWIALRKQLPGLTVLNQGDQRLRNPYALILVNPQRHPHTNHNRAHDLVEWFVSPEIQARIGNYKIDGAVLFRPMTPTKDQ